MRTSDHHDRNEALATFDSIARLTRENGGGTFQRYTGAPVELTDGYTVGVGRIAQIGVGVTADQQNVRTILAYYWPTKAPANAQYVGTWLEDAVLHIDHVTVISDLSIALALARKRGERYIYDNARGECLPVDTGYIDERDYPPVFCADAPPDTVWWRKDEPFCPHCDAPLSETGSVRYTEVYDASIWTGSFGVTVEYASHSVESHATCAACCGVLDYEDVNATS